MRHPRPYEDHTTLDTDTMKKNKGKGHMLSRLIGGGERNRGNASSSGVPQELSLRALKGGSWQPRQNFDDSQLRELAASIREHGLLQPVLVRPSATEAGRYEIVAGERRWRACRLVGMDTIPVKICFVGDQEAALMALVENLQREDLQTIDTAKSLQRLSIDFELSHEEVADLLGKSRSTVSNLLRLLKLPEPLHVALAQQKIDMGHARALLGIDDEELQIKLADHITQHSLTVRETEAIVRRVREGEPLGVLPVPEPSVPATAEPSSEEAVTENDDAPVEPDIPPEASPVASVVSGSISLPSSATEPLPAPAPTVMPPLGDDPEPRSRLDPDARRLEERLAVHLGTLTQLRPVDGDKEGGHIEVRYHDVAHLQEVLRRMGLAEEPDDGGAETW